MSDSLAAEARRLRTVEELSVRQIQDRLGVSKRRLYELLRGVSAPAWTKRPNAKDELRAAAEELRARGRSVNDIALELGVAKSTAYQWVKHLPLDPDTEAQRARRREHSKRMTDARWAAHREARDLAQAEAHASVAQQIGPLTERDILILGAAIYWCEGAKSKPWRRDDHVQLINSDVRLLAMFLRFLEVCGINRCVPSYRVSIHESADAEAAVAWWVETLTLPIDRFRRSTLKRHNPRTRRYNTGNDYHGCLIINVPGSRELYWRVEGMIAALFEGSGATQERDR